jgi:hypothetical protein
MSRARLASNKGKLEPYKRMQTWLSLTLVRWGAEMYEWHAKHPEKGDRFRRAMRGVSKCKSFRKYIDAELC